jgi:hypothetical protein
LFISLKLLGFFGDCFVVRPPMKQFLPAMKPFRVLAQTSGNSAWLSVPQQDGRQRRPRTRRDSQMRTFSFILAFAFVLVGPSMAGTLDNGLPGIGTFAYSGAPVAVSVPQMMVVAAR